MKRNKKLRGKVLLQKKTFSEPSNPICKYVNLKRNYICTKKRKCIQFRGMNETQIKKKKERQDDRGTRHAPNGRIGKRRGKKIYQKKKKKK